MAVSKFFVKKHYYATDVSELPTGAKVGDICFVKNSNELYFYDGNSWQSVNSGGGGGGSATMQDVFNNGSQILKGPGQGLVLRDSGIEYGNVEPNLLVDSNNRTAGAFSTNAGKPKLSALDVSLQDTSFTVPASDRVDLGVDLLALPYPPQVVGTNPSVIFNSSLLVIKDSDNAADEKTYTIVGIANGSATNSVAILANLDGTPANLSSTTGTAVIFNLRQNYASGANDLGNLYVSPTYDTLFQDVKLYSGNYGGSPPEYVIFTGTGTAPMRLYYNASGAAVPYIQFIHGGTPPDTADMVLVARTSDPTTNLTAGGLIYRVDLGELRIWNGTSWDSIGGGGGTLDQAYDFGGPGAGRVITADAGPVQITTPDGDTEAFFITDNSGTWQVSVYPKFIRLPSVGSADITPTGGEIWKDSSTSRMRYGYGTIARDVSFKDEILFDAVVGGTAPDYATVNDAIAAGKRRILVVTSTTESVKVNVPAGRNVRVYVAEGEWYIPQGIDINADASLSIIGLGNVGRVPNYSAMPKLRFELTADNTHAINFVDFTASCEIRNMFIRNTSPPSSTNRSLFSFSNGRAIIENCGFENANSGVGSFIRTNGPTAYVHLKDVVIYGQTGNSLYIDGTLGSVIVDGLSFDGAFTASVTVVNFPQGSRVTNVSFENANVDLRIDLQDSCSISNVNQVTFKSSLIAATNYCTISNCSLQGGSVALFGFNNAVSNCFVNNIQVSSNSNTITGCNVISSIVVNTSYNVISGNRVAEPGGGTTATINLSPSSSNNLVTGNMVDSAVVDNGTGNTVTNNKVI